MPYYKKRYGRKRKTYRRKKMRGRRPLTSRYTPSGMPAQRIAKLRYAEQVELTSTLGGLTEHRFSCNNAYDPNTTGTGHQPMGYDQWSALFNHYTVLGAKVTINTLQNAGAVNPGYIGVYTTDGTSNPYTSADEFIEAKRGSFTQLVADQAHVKRLVSKFSTKKFFNVSDVKDNSELKASVTASPSEVAFWNIWYHTTDGTTNSVKIMVVIDFIVSFSEPKDLSQS